MNLTSELSPLQRLGRVLRADTTSGILLVIAAILALVLANGPTADGYAALRDATTHVPLGPLSLDLTIGEWASDGLLAIFFFVVGVELKHEFVDGSLSRVDAAITPVAAALGGVAVPAILFAGLVLADGGEGLHGWAVPTATDIAFATAVLALVGRRLPRALKVFLLTLAVVDDLVAIIIIAVVYADGLAPVWLVAALVPLAAFTLMVRRGAGALARHAWLAWLTLVPLGAVTWLLVHASGIHATIAGVVLGLVVPATALRRGRPTPRAAAAEPSGPAELPLTSVLSHRVGPWSSALCVPVFAFFAAGVSVAAGGGLGEVVRDPVTWGVILGLVVGKPLGILLATWAVTRFTPASLDPSLRWRHLTGVAMLGGIGFTVALLVSELAFGHGSPHAEHATLAVLVGSLVSAVLGSAWLALSSRRP